ncbi:hypothetical protein HHI36_022064 [Cryptolaemus montrouzieri]|uniref:Uncharacterized protein n=1 Tax=Cryptolaemus montrouzieri TaxID=559131 RepID=A0ABD2MYW2_9CUCU
MPCLMNAAQDSFAKLKAGNSDLGMPSLDPLRISKLSIDSGKVVQLVQNYEEVELFGLTDCKVIALSFDLDNGKLEVTGECPHLDMNSTYAIKGKVLMFDVFGSGKDSIRLGKVTGKLMLDLETYTQDNDVYLRVTQGVFDFNAENCFIKFDNLFDGNTQLGENINQVLNDNWKVIMDELKHGYGLAIGTEIKDVANKLFSQVPLKEIFLNFEMNI